MPPQTATILSIAASQLFGVPNNTFEAIRVPLCCEIKTNAATSLDKFPLLLFSPGLQATRLYYTYLAATLAAQGYVVVTMDHPYEAPVVEYPNGQLVFGLNDTVFDPRVEGTLDKALAVRVADARFVLDQLSNASVVKKILPQVAAAGGGGKDCGGLDTQRVGFFGHSFGGATALASLAQDPRFGAGLNMDGTQYGDVSGLRRSQSILFFGRAAPNPHNSTDDATWRTGLAAAKGWKKEIGLKDSAHNTFGDVPILLKTAGWPLPDALKDFVGNLDGARSFEIIGTYVRSYFGLALKGERTRLFDGESKQFPEVVVNGEK